MIFTLDKLTPKERNALADRCGTDYIYLWQIGKGIRLPSLTLADKLMDADNRITVKGLLAPKLARDAANDSVHQHASTSPG